MLHRHAAASPQQLELLLLLCGAALEAAGSGQSGHGLRLLQPEDQSLDSRPHAGARSLLQGEPTPIRSTAEKVAHAEAVHNMRPELLLKNLKVKEQQSTEFVPESCTPQEEGVATKCAPPLLSPLPRTHPHTCAARPRVCGRGPRAPPRAEGAAAPRVQGHRRGGGCG